MKLSHKMIDISKRLIFFQRRLKISYKRKLRIDRIQSIEENREDRKKARYLWGLPEISVGSLNTDIMHGWRTVHATIRAVIAPLRDKANLTDRVNYVGKLRYVATI